MQLFLLLMIAFEVSLQLAGVAASVAGMYFLGPLFPVDSTLAQWLELTSNENFHEDN